MNVNVFADTRLFKSGNGYVYKIPIWIQEHLLFCSGNLPDRAI